MLSEKKLKVSFVEEKYWERRLDFLRMSPAGKVPVLIGRQGILPESQAVCEYLDAIYPDPPLMPESPAEQYEVRRLMFWFNEKFNQEVTSKLLLERMLRKLQGRGEPNGNNLMAGRKFLRFHLEYLDTLLFERAWVAGNRMTLADFAAAAHFSCLDYINDINWSEHSNIKTWYATMKSRPAFRALLADYVPGGPLPPAHYADLDF